VAGGDAIRGEGDGALTNVLKGTAGGLKRKKHMLAKAGGQHGQSGMLARAVARRRAANKRGLAQRVSRWGTTPEREKRMKRMAVDSVDASLHAFVGSSRGFLLVVMENSIDRGHQRDRVVANKFRQRPGNATHGVQGGDLSPELGGARSAGQGGRKA
jgi:hypothetical protein